MSNIKTALESAIEAMDWELGGEPLPTLMLEAREQCKSALAELNHTASAAILPNGVAVSNVREAYEEGQRQALAELERANKLLKAEAKTNYDFIQQVWLAHPNVDLDIDAMEKSNE